MADVLRAPPRRDGARHRGVGLPHEVRRGGVVDRASGDAVAVRGHHRRGRRDRRRRGRAGRRSGRGGGRRRRDRRAHPGRGPHGRRGRRPALRRADDRAHHRRRGCVERAWPRRSCGTTAPDVPCRHAGDDRRRPHPRPGRPELPEWFLELHDTMGIGPDQPPRPRRAARRGGRPRGPRRLRRPVVRGAVRDARRVGRGRRRAQPDGPLPDPRARRSGCWSPGCGWPGCSTATPEILDLPVEAPVVVLGLPRTGTSHLLDLLSADPALPLPPLLGEPRADRARRRPAAGRRSRPAGRAHRARAHDAQHRDAAVPGHARDDARTAPTRKSSCWRSTSPRCSSRPATTSPATPAGTGRATRPTPTGP